MKKYESIAFSSYCQNNSEYHINNLNACNQNQVFLKNKRCMPCGIPGTFTKSTQSKQQCLCNPSQLVWNEEGFCDCGENKAMTVQGTKITCSVCNSAINSQSKANSQSCKCINQDLLSWNQTLIRCQCPYPHIFIDGNCISCEQKKYSVGIHKDKRAECLCKHPLVWDRSIQQCKCKKGVIFEIDDIISCVTCGKNTNSYFQPAISTTSCNCPPGIHWLDNIGCVCNNNDQLLIPGKVPECILCNKNIFAIGISQNGKECDCINDQFKWNPDKKKCTCLKNNQVPIINQNQSFACFYCHNKKRLTTLPIIDDQCSCVNKDLLLWNPKGYCECLSPENEIYVDIPAPRCIACDQTVYSNGRHAISNICKCKNTLMSWNQKLSTCSCRKQSQVLILDQNGQPQCYQCDNSSKLTQLPVAEGQCSCIDQDNLIWFEEGFCGCPDQTSQIYLKKPKPRCITCDQTINADGISQNQPSSCKCISDLLIFYNGFCDCGRNSAYIIDSSGEYMCVNCLNSNQFLRSKNSSNSCNCLSDDMIWNEETGYCDCPKGTFFYGKMNIFKCIICTGKNKITTLNENNQQFCQCSDVSMNLVITEKNETSCVCPVKNSILTIQGHCFVCPRDQTSFGSLLGAHQCKCYTGNYWDYRQNQCISCSEIVNAKQNIGNGFSCECQSFFIWDIVSQKCIEISEQEAFKLNCDEILYNDGQPSSLKKAFPQETRSQFNTIEAALQFYSATNYPMISKYQCGCIEGYLWDEYRLMCLSKQLI